MRCDVCNGEDFVEEDGLYYCSECLTQKEGKRVQLHEFDAHLSQRPVSSQVKLEPEADTSNEKILSSWETFNICLKGLVDQLIQFGATPKLEAVVFNLWTSYLKKTGAAFFSIDKLTPKLPIHAWKSDVLLVLNPQTPNEAIDQLVGRQRKGMKRKFDDTNEEAEADQPSKDEMPPLKELTKKQGQVIKRNFFNKIFAETASERVPHETTDIMSLIYVPEVDPSQMLNDAVSKVDDPKIVPLRRNHLLAFLHLGVLLSHEEIYLSDILRWIDEGHLHYNQLDKFFIPGLTVLEDLKEFFMERKFTPPYSAISLLTRKLAVFLGVCSIAHPDLKKLIHKYCNEFNLPNQVALVSRRLVNLLPTRAENPRLRVTITSHETRAMAQIIVTLKILLGLDDATEHRNSKIAAEISEALKMGGSTIEPFIWDEWVRWNSLRSIALLLHGHDSVAPRRDTGLYQNIDSLVKFWRHCVSSAIRARLAVRRKTETEFMCELIQSLDTNFNLSGEEISRCPPTTTPLTTYTEAVIKDLMQNRLPCSDDSWNSIARNIDFSDLDRDFRRKSIEYLLHPERYIEWVQQKGLSIGLRNGGAFEKAYRASQAVVRKESYSKHTLSWRVSLSNKGKKTFEKEPQDPGAKSVVLPASTRQDETYGRPLEPLLDLTEHVPPIKKKKDPRSVPPAASMPTPGDEDRYLHLPSTEYHTQSGKAREAPISFKYLIEQAARYLRISKSDLLDEITFLEDIHQNFLRFCSGDIDKYSPEIIALKE